MNAGDLQAAWRSLPVTTPDILTGGRPIVIISPHPDDESLGMGGIIAASREAGADVRVVVISDGAQSHPRSERFPRDRLVTLRRAEVEAAAEHLGLPQGAVTHLDLPDAAVPSSGLAFDAAVAHLAAVVDDSRAAAVFVTWGGDPHCDHEAAAAMAARLREHRPGVAFFCYPIWGWHLEPTMVLDALPPRGYRVDIARWLPAKQRAIAAHASQMTELIDDDPEGFRFTPETLAPFLAPVETVFEMPA